MPKAGTHNENRSKVCLLCFGRSKVMSLVQGKLKSYVEKMYEYDPCDERLPNAVCTTCKRKLYIVKDDTENTVKLSIFSDLEPLKNIKTRLSSKALCNCYVCQLVRYSVPTNILLSESKSSTSKKCFTDITNKEISGIILFNLYM